MTTTSDSNIPNACITAYALSHHPIYRISQIYQFVILTLAVCPLVYFIFFKIIRSRFHGNLKFIQVVIPLIVSNECDLIINPFYYRIGCITGSLLMTLPTFFPISITIERFFATKMAKSYEKTPVMLGPILTVSVMFSFFWMMLALNIVNFVFNFFLLNKNSRLKKSNSTLTARYQLEEVYLSTKFAISVIFVHVIFFGIYVSLTILSRYFGGFIIEDPINLSAVRGALMTMIATYNLIIGILAVYLYKRIQIKKSVEINGKIQMKSTGKAGARNYENAIFSIWNSTSSVTSRPTNVR
ncbi:hypothetical protein GCK72_009836 [Caenorhabditis remanei]|uniref:Uncharacterized protein n=1 Tax=Caenorhabditis remanei TaxID=31234 RepID=A0A6A5H1B1_CAERE|nr:hypothetical protein GCK72_009836 [Caenorhabditis remanei]KAF1761580.1 hypothetical protein GCK72_009836 [Caenorhabditis remanei]